MYWDGLFGDDPLQLLKHVIFLCAIQNFLADFRWVIEGFPHDRILVYVEKSYDETD